MKLMLLISDQFLETGGTLINPLGSCFMEQ